MTLVSFLVIIGVGARADSIDNCALSTPCKSTLPLLSVSSLSSSSPNRSPSPSTAPTPSTFIALASPPLSIHPKTTFRLEVSRTLFSSTFTLIPSALSHLRRSTCLGIGNPSALGEFFIFGPFGRLLMFLLTFSAVPTSFTVVWVSIHMVNVSAGLLKPSAMPCLCAFSWHQQVSFAFLAHLGAFCWFLLCL